ncbi:MAG: hypothetical protein NWQ38_07240 [Cellulophaga sp.]|nr:hypothetical protein [Cellulophaga sp.]
MFNEHHRLKIRTLSGERLVGNFFIVDSNTISIKNENIALSEIKRIRSKRAFSKYLGGSFVGLGSYTVLISPLTAIMAEDGAKNFRTTALIGVGVVALGILIKQATPPAHHHEKWDYKIIINE